MTYYSTGTVTVANGGTTVTGVGTGWAGKIKAGDLFSDPAQGLVARVTADATSDTSLSINAWPGTALAGDPYEVLFTSDVTRMQQTTRDLLEALASAANVGFAPPSGMTSDDVQEAIEELFATIDGFEALPPGGAAGEVLKKQSGTDGDADWEPSLPALAASAGAPASLDFAEQTTNGTSRVRVQAPAALAADYAFTLPPANVVLSSFIAALLNSTAAAGAQAAIGVREKLTANRTYYVDGTNGNDANTGLSAGSGNAFKTIQKAIDVAAGLDCSTFNLTVSVANGTYTENVTTRQLLGSGVFALVGNNGSPGSVIISPAAGNSISHGGGTWTVTGFKLVAAAGNCLFNNASGQLLFGSVEFGAASNAQIYSVGSNAQIIQFAYYTVSGSAVIHAAAANAGYIYLAGATVTFSASVTFSYFVYCELMAFASVGSMTFTLGGFTVTGQRFQVSGQAVIVTYGGGLAYLPGTVAGAGFTGGRYDEITYFYGAGSGGTVTQATSKSTGVMLNKASGQITMNNAALAANTEVTFTLTNSAIAADDILVFNHSLTAKYVVNAVCAAGSAAITVRNVTAGSLSEALVIKYGLLKAVAA